MSTAEKLTTIAENQEKVYEAGFKNHTELHMQNCDNYGSYMYAFSGVGWRDNSYNPIRTIVTEGNMNNLFYLSKITDTKVDIDVSLATLNRAALFSSAQNLKTIRKIITTQNNSYANWFVLCSKLENITFEGEIGKSIDFQYCTLLTKASIENIVSCLSESVTDQTLTLSQTAVNNAFTTGEWNALIANKTNWTFSLV